MALSKAGTTKSTRLRWKKHAKATGLSSIGAGPRGSDYTDGTRKYATVYAHSTRHTGKRGWWWVASFDDVYCNRCGIEGMTEEQAKQQAQEFVKAEIAAVSQPRGRPGEDA